MINKVVSSFDEAVADIPSGATIHVGGLTHWPSELIAAVARRGIRDLTVISCSLAMGGPSNAPRPSGRGPQRAAPPDAANLVTVGLWLELGLIRKGITSFASSMRGDDRMPFEALVEQGLAEVELTSQGVLAERIRAVKAGVPAFYTTTGVGTPPAAHKEVREFNGVAHIMETAIQADFALVRAYRGDRYGNLVYNQPSSFNSVMAGAATVTIAEVDEILPLGDLPPEQIRTPGAFVDRIVQIPATLRASWQEAC